MLLRLRMHMLGAAGGARLRTLCSSDAWSGLPASSISTMWLSSIRARPLLCTNASIVDGTSNRTCTNRITRTLHQPK